MINVLYLVFFVGILSFTCPFWENTACTGFSQEEAQTQGKQIICQFSLKGEILKWKSGNYFPKGVWAEVFPIKHPVSIYVLMYSIISLFHFPQFLAFSLPLFGLELFILTALPPLTFKQGVWHLNEPNVLNACSYISRRRSNWAPYCQASSCLFKDNWCWRDSDSNALTSVLREYMDMSFQPPKGVSTCILDSHLQVWGWH